MASGSGGLGYLASGAPLIAVPAVLALGNLELRLALTMQVRTCCLGLEAGVTRTDESPLSDSAREDQDFGAGHKTHQAAPSGGNCAAIFARGPVDDTMEQLLTQTGGRPDTEADDPPGPDR